MNYAALLKNKISILIICCFSLTIHIAFAQINLDISLNQTQFQPGDTIKFKCTIPSWRNTQKIGTLGIFMEDLNHRFIWQLRYPVLEGLSEGDLVIPDSFPNALYSMYFQLQDAFFGVEGSIDQRYKSKRINYSLQLTSGDLVSGEAEVDVNGRFKLPRHVFPGQAKLFFTEVKKSAVNNELNIQIKTPLDSALRAVGDTLVFIGIGEIADLNIPDEYKVTPVIFNDTSGSTLRNVTVTAKAKTPIEAFDEQFSSGQFRSKDAYVIDLLNNPFSGYTNILDYLVGRIPGLTAIGRMGGDYTIRWRGETPSFFLDEVPIFPESIFMIPFNDIAMVKAYRTPMVRSFLGGSGGVIAIYTKRGGDIGLPNFRNKFPVNGYTPLVYTLMPNQKD